MSDKIFQSPRFYGGHYDSVKQGYVRDALNNDPNKAAPWQPQLIERYTARLRLDILFAGSVIITDAQFYDGAIFHELMAEENARKDFLNFLRVTAGQQSPLIEVRRRAKGLGAIVFKPFKFSSVASNKVSREIREAMQKAKDAGVTETFTSVKQAFQEYANYADNNNTKIAIEELAERLLYLDNIPAGIFREWDSARNIVDGFKLAKAEYKFLSKDKKDFEIPRWGNREVDEVLEKVDVELQKDFPNRSEIERLVRDAKVNNPAHADWLNSLYGAINQIFNRAFAYQHVCNCMDLGDAPASLSDFGEPFDLLSPQLIEDLGTQSWKEFLHKITHDPIKTYWQEWRDLINQRESEKNIKKAAQKFVDAIQTSYRITPMRRLVEIIGGGSSDAVLTTNGLSFQPSLGTVITLAVNLPATINKLKQHQKDKSNLLRFGLSLAR